MGLYLSLWVIEGADHEFFYLLRRCTDPLGCTGEGGLAKSLGSRLNLKIHISLSIRARVFKLGGCTDHLGGYSVSKKFGPPPPPLCRGEGSKSRLRVSETNFGCV